VGEINRGLSILKKDKMITHEGKLDDLHARFANHTMDLFEKHGMTVVIMHG